METLSVFQYQSARRFLLDYVELKKKSDASFSIRRWSKEMGLGSHALMIMILQGKRTLTLKQAPYIAQGAKLTTPEQMYFQALIQLENAKTPEEEKFCRTVLADFNQGSGSQVREVDEYLAISHWLHMALLAMTRMKAFSGSAQEAYRMLGKKIPIEEIRVALERLKDLGILANQNGKLKPTASRITTRDDVASRGAKEYHKQVAALAAVAVEEQPVDVREFQSFALPVSKSQLPLAKEMIRKFRTQFSDAISSEGGDEVYQLNVQFFRLTDCPSEMVLKVDEGAGPEVRSKKGRAQKLDLEN